MEVQENNVDLSDFKIPKIYKNGEWIEFPDYRINRDGTKVYSLKCNRYLNIRKHKTREYFYLCVDMCDSYGKIHRCLISNLIWFTFEHDKLDLSGCKTLYYNYKYYPRYLINNNGTIIFDIKTRKIISQSMHITNKYKKYLRVRLILDGICELIDVHRLVKWTFTGGPETEIKNPIDPTVDHKNGSSNHIDNLRWVERGLNAAMGTAGSKNGNAIINENIARQICVALKYEDSTISLLDIANNFNVRLNTIQRIYYNYSWKGISMQYAPFPKRPRTRVKNVGLNES